MGCGCNKKRGVAPAATRVTYEVWVNDASTGRRFTSLILATSYAQRVGGEVRTI